MDHGYRRGVFSRAVGHDVAVVMGSPRNIKITAPADMELAEFYLRSSDRH